MEIRRMDRQGVTIYLPNKKPNKPNLRNIPLVFHQQYAKKRSRHEDGSMRIFNRKIKEAQDRFNKQYINLEWKQQKKGGYIYIDVELDGELYQFLEHIGFLRFHETNRGEIIYQHQLVKYLFGNGHKLYANGYYARKGEVEIHHLDNDPTNNRVYNLKYVSPQLNRYCSESLFLPYHGNYFNRSSLIPEGTREADKMKYLTLEKYLGRYGVYCHDRQKLEEILQLFRRYGRDYITSRLGTSPEPSFLRILGSFASNELSSEYVVKQIYSDYCHFTSVEKKLAIQAYPDAFTTEANGY